MNMLTNLIKYFKPTGYLSLVPPALIIAAPLLFLFLNSCNKEMFVEPKPGPRSAYTKFYIDSSPQGAEILVEGRTTGYFTPDTLNWLDEGVHNITLLKTNFFDTSFTIQSKTGSTEKVLIDYYLNPRMLGSIFCYSNPAGAKIYLDDENTGKVTPYTLKMLIPKEYKVKFEYPEYRQDSVNVTVRSMGLEIASRNLEDTLDVVTFKKENSGLKSSYITGIAEDKKGNIWFGTGDEGLVKYDGKKYSTYRMGDYPFMTTNYVKKVKSDKENNIFVGLANSIARFDGNNWESFPSDAIYTIQITPDNTMLASSDRKGIVKYSDGKFSWINKENSGMPENELVTMCYDNSKRLWIAPVNGNLYYQEPDRWVTIDSIHDGIPYSHICGMNLTNDGKIIVLFYWQPNSKISYTSHSLAVFQDGVWVRMFEKVRAIIEDKDLLIDSKNRTWYPYLNAVTVMGRISNTTFTRETLFTNIISKDIRKFKNWSAYNFELFFEGNQVFIDSKNNLWIYGPKGAIKVKAGRWKD